MRLQFDHTYRLQGWWLEMCWGIQPVRGHCQISTKRMGSPKAGHGNIHYLMEVIQVFKFQVHWDVILRQLACSVYLHTRYKSQSNARSFSFLKLHSRQHVSAPQSHHQAFPMNRSKINIYSAFGIPSVYTDDTVGII